MFQSWGGRLDYYSRETRCELAHDLLRNGHVKGCMDNLRRVLVGLDPIPHEATIDDKAIVDEFPEHALEGYRVEDEPEREQATFEDF